MQTHFVTRLLLLAALMLLGATIAPAEVPTETGLNFGVTPAATGQQLVRASVPVPRGLLSSNQVFVLKTGLRFEPVGLRVLSWHPVTQSEPPTARRVLVSFPYYFPDLKPVRFTLQATTTPNPELYADFPVMLSTQGESIHLAWKDGRTMDLQLLAPVRTSSAAPALELVETNRFFRWQRLHYPDVEWPRVIESRLDALGGVALVGHVQRHNTNDSFAPELGWRLSTSATSALLRCGESKLTNQPLGCSFAEGNEATCVIDGQISIYHPTAPLKRRGGIEIVPEANGLWTYCYQRNLATDKVPMQPMSWQRAELVIAPPGLARLTSSLRNRSSITS